MALLFVLACGGGGGPDIGAETEVVVPDANFAVAMDFAPDGRLFYNEQYTGNIRIVTPDGELLEEPFAHIDDALGTVEFGLIGLALDPEFQSNSYVYVLYTQRVDEDTARPVVMRLTDQNNRGADPEIIVGDLPETFPGAFFNAAGNIHFGPDGYLYISIGDYNLQEVAQDLSTAPGKILRVSKEDGSAPADNPLLDMADADERIFAYGLRKVPDFAFHPDTGDIYAPDNNSETCDELNIVRAGENYGWPLSFEHRFSSCTEDQPTSGIHFFAHEGSEGRMDPLDHLSVVNPSGVEFVSGDVYLDIGDSLLVCERASRLIRALVLEGASQDRVASDDIVTDDCALDIAVSPDGIVYYSNDTEIRRIVPR